MLTLLSAGNVYLREINDGNSGRSDDLRVKEISAAGMAVWINVDNGSLVDGNGKVWTALYGFEKQPDGSWKVVNWRPLRAAPALSAARAPAPLRRPTRG